MNLELGHGGRRAFLPLMPAVAKRERAGPRITKPSAPANGAAQDRAGPRQPVEGEQLISDQMIPSDRRLLLAHCASAGAQANALIPTCIDHDPRAHLRRPIVMMCQG
jgi:hypothetical protein